MLRDRRNFSLPILLHVKSLNIRMRIGLRYHLHSPELPFGERLFENLDRFQRHLSNLVDLLDFRKQKEHFLTGQKGQTLFDVNFAPIALIFLAVIFFSFWWRSRWTDFSRMSFGITMVVTNNPLPQMGHYQILG